MPRAPRTPRLAPRPPRPRRGRQRLDRRQRPGDRRAVPGRAPGPQRRQRRVRGQQPGPARPRPRRLRGPGQRRLVRRARAGCGRWWRRWRPTAGLGAASARMLFADRFLESAVESPTFVPGAADVRELGVMVSGARVDGKDRWRDTQFGEGTWGIEHDRAGGTFQWTHATRSCGSRWPTPRRPAAPRCPTRSSCAWRPRRPRPSRWRPAACRPRSRSGPSPAGAACRWPASRSTW